MRLPFLQIESDLVAHGGAEVAQLAGCSLVQAIGHITLLRAWAVSRATDEAPPDGVVVGESSGRRIEAAAQWTGEKGALLRALIDAGHVLVVDNDHRRDHRILHLEPYQKAWERNANAKARMANAREQARIQRERSANMPVSGANEPANHGVRAAYQPVYPAGKTQTQKEDVEEKKLSPAGAVAAPEVDERQAVMPGFEPPTPPEPEQPKERRPSAGEELYAKIQRVRRTLCDEAGESYVDDRWTSARQNKFLGPIAKGSEQDKAVFETAFGEFMADEAHKAKGWPLSLFMHGATRARYEKRALDALKAAS